MARSLFVFLVITVMFGVICNSPCFEARKLLLMGVEDNEQLPSSEKSPVSSALPKGFADGRRGYDAHVGWVYPLTESNPSPGAGH